MIRFRLVRPLRRIPDSKYHPSDALLLLFKLIYSTLSNFKIQLKIERSLWVGWPGARGHNILCAATTQLRVWAASPPRATPTEAESWVQMEPLGERTASEIRKSVRRNQIRTLRHSNANYSPQGPQIRGRTLHETSLH